MNNIINSSGIYDINAYNLTTNNATVLSTLNIGGYIIGSGTGLTNLIYGNIIKKPDLASTANLDSLSTTSTLNISNLQATSTTIFNNLNSLSTYSNLNISNLQATSTSLLNKTNFTNLWVSSDSTFLSSLNISGFTLLKNITTINSSLNVSGYTTLSGGTITGKVFMNGTIVNDHSLQIRTDNYTAPLLQIDAGVRRAVAIYSNPRAIGKVFLGLGGRASAGVGDYYAIGLGYLYNPTGPYCCEIGVVITNFAGAECGDLIFSTRNTTGQYDVATERMRIKSDGTITINNNTTCISSFNVSGVATLNNNTTLSSSLNVSGTTTLNNNTTLSSSLNVSGFTTLNNNTSCISSFNVSGFTTLNNNTTLSSSLNVSGITTLNNYTIINGTTQLEPKILLSGQEYLIPFQTATDGVALLLGTNRVNNRLLFIGDSAKLTQNTTNPIVSINPTGRFDCTSTDGSLRLPAVFNGAIYTNATYNTTLISSLNVSGTTTLLNNTTCVSSLMYQGQQRYQILQHDRTCLSSFNVSGLTTLSNNLTVNGDLYLKNSTWHKSVDGVHRLYYGVNDISYYCCGGNLADGHIFMNNAYTHVFKIKNNGDLYSSGNIDCGGGIAINGSTAFYNPSNTIDSGNLTNTYLNLKYAGADSDWCYIRQIGVNNTYKLAFDFHDDVDARFCIRSITSTDNPDTVTDVFTVDNGNVSCTGSATSSRIITHNNTFPDFTAVNNATTHSIINIFPGINGQQGALTTDAYNIYLSSFAYGTYMSGPQPYITVNCTMLYNGSNTKLTLQAYGNATGAGFNSKIILNGGNNSAGSTSFINDNVTTCTMNSSGLTVSDNLTIGNGLVYFSKAGNATGTIKLGHRGASPCTLHAHYAHYAHFSKLARPPKIKL